MAVITGNGYREFHQLFVRRRIKVGDDVTVHLKKGTKTYRILGVESDNKRDIKLYDAEAWLSGSCVYYNQSSSALRGKKWEIEL